ncbi:MAG: FAD-binding protein, partial [Candidatus Bathyarchaeia archaeon]
MTEILEADVLVIGGGLAGCRAAIEAAENNVETIIVDRGIIGRFGATNCALWSIQAP